MQGSNCLEDLHQQYRHLDLSYKHCLKTKMTKQYEHHYSAPIYRITFHPGTLERCYIFKIHCFTENQMSSNNERAELRFFNTRYLHHQWPSNCNHLHAICMGYNHGWTQSQSLITFRKELTYIKAFYRPTLIPYNNNYLFFVKCKVIYKQLFFRC